ncbi:MAG: GFA family protein [Paracoccaceae bacterium]
MTTHKGTCFCGAVELEVSGAPEAMGYCHCGSCRSWSAGPVNAFSLWKDDSVKITKGHDHLGHFMKTPTVTGTIAHNVEATFSQNILQWG